MAKARRSYRKRTARKVRKGGRRTRRQNRRKVGGWPSFSRAPSKPLDWENGFTANRTVAMNTVYVATYTPGTLALDFTNLSRLVQLQAKTKILELFQAIGINLTGGENKYFAVAKSAITGNQYFSNTNIVTFTFFEISGQYGLESVNITSSKEPVLNVNINGDENQGLVVDQRLFMDGFNIIKQKFEELQQKGELTVV